jgi:hypothetical protein
MISTVSPQDLLTRTCTRSCKDLLKDFSRISTRASHVRNFDQDLHARTPKRIPQDLQKRTCCCSLQDDETMNSQEHRAAIQAPLIHGICKVFTQDLLRTCARSCEDLLEDVSQTFTRSSHKDHHKIIQGPRTGFHQDPPRVHHETLARSS